MSTVELRLSAVRELMAQGRYDALLVPRADEYLGEYLPAHNERLRWLTGFTGSAGMAVILAQRAAIFVDGRYTVQVRNEVSPDLFAYHHLADEPQAQWLAEQLPAGARVACDPRLHSLDWYRATDKTLTEAGLELVADADNLIDRCWRDRPAPIVQPALLLEDSFAGECSAAKRLRLTSVGLLQYIAPSLTLVLAVALYAEPFTRAHAIVFGCVWLGLALFTLDSLSRVHRQRRVARDQGVALAEVVEDLRLRLADETAAGDRRIDRGDQGQAPVLQRQPADGHNRHQQDRRQRQATQHPAIRFVEQGFARDVHWLPERFSRG